MMRFLYSIAVLLFLINPIFAQQKCGQHILENAERQANPELDALMILADEAATLESGSSNARAETLVIPLVFHIIHMNGEENISDAQVRDCVRTMNLDFNANNVELLDIVPSFQNIIGNAEVEFRLATIDKNGNPTTGIERIVSNETFTGDEGSKLNIWPREKYINIWVTDVITVNGTVNGAAAYTRRPFAANGSPNTDGIITNHRYVGTIGTSTVSRSKTLSHEMGHFFNLMHTWGDSNDPGCDGTSTNPNDPCFGVNNCGQDDGVSDTPNTIGVDNGSCNLNANTCGSLDNVQNFLDYSSCDAMFTKGQVTRMRAALNSSVAQRNNLWTSSNLAATGVSELTAANYYVNRPTACQGEFVQFYDASTYDPDSWSWEISGPDQLTSTDQNPVFEMRFPGIYTVKLTVTQGSITKTIENEDAFVVASLYGSPMNFKESFDGENRGWLAVNNDLADSEHNWELNETVGYDDSYSYKMSNFGQDGYSIDDLIFSSIDFRPMTSVSMSFKLAYVRTNSTNNDKLSVSVSNDCGDSWTTFWTGLSAVMNDGKTSLNSQFTPQSNGDWLSVSVPVIPTSWLSENALIRFRFESGGGNNLYLDDININGDFSAIPYLVYPPNGAVEMNNDVKLNWLAVSGSSEYQFEISKSATFSTIANSGTISTIDDGESLGEDTEYRNDVLDNGDTYYWHVRAKVSGAYTDWSETWSFTVADDGVGFSELTSAQQMIVYPNPSSGTVNIRLDNAQEEVEIRVYNLNGQLVQSKYVGKTNPSSDISFSTNGLNAGCYMLEVSSLSRKWNQLLMVNPNK